MKSLVRTLFTCLFVVFGARAALAWPHGALGTLVYPNAQVSMPVADGSGGTWVAFSVYGGTSNYDLYVQHYDHDGTALIPGVGLLLCNAADIQQVQSVGSDYAGGIVVAWLDYRAGGFAQQDFYAQRVTAAGTIAWTANGAPVVTATAAQTNLRMVTTTAGAWFAWADARNNAVTNKDIYAQFFAMASGAPGMPVNGLALCTATGPQDQPDITADNYTCCVAWSDARGATNDIYAQCATSNGGLSWTVNGLPVCSAAGGQYEPRVRITGNTRYYVTWSDFRSSDYDVYAQLIEGFNASMDWTVNGVAVCALTGTQYVLDATVDVNGHLVVAWSDTRRGAQTQDLYLQKLDPSGTAQWATNGTPIRTVGGNAANLKLAPLAAGGVFAVWEDARADVGDVYAQRVSASGASLWTANGVALGTGDYQQAAPQVALDSDGAAFCTWADYRTNGTGARVQYVDEWGKTGANPILASVKDVPNDQGGFVKVSWYASALDTDPLDRSITDYVLFRSAPQSLAAQLAARATLAEDGTASVTAGGKRYVRFPTMAQDYFWEELAHVTPRHFAQYSYLAPTSGDSVAGSNRRTAFLVLATATASGGWWASKADSGYSVDNLAPLAPAPLTGQYGAGTTALHWMPNAEADLAGYRIYRGSSASFTPSLANRVAAVADTGYADVAAAPYFYKVTAVDTHGNESPVATLMPSGTLGVDGGAARAMFAAPAPNPLRGGAASTLRFALAVGGRTKLALYDAQGRVARVLVDGALEAGEHAVTLKGDGLAPGLYLARLESPGFTAARRVMVVE